MIRPGELLYVRAFDELWSLTFPPQQIRSAFADGGFIVRTEEAQFLLPMVLHRLADQPVFSKVTEFPGRVLGLTRWLGSPVIVRADPRIPAA